MKKVLFLLPTDSLAGAELTLKRIAIYLTSQGDNVFVVFMSKGDRGFWKDVGAKKIYLNSDREVKALPLLCKALIELRIQGHSFDYAFSSHVHCNAFISVARLFKMLKVDHQVVRESTNIFSWFSGKRLALFKLCYRFYAQDVIIICQTKRMLNELLINVPKLKQNNTFVLNNVVEFDEIIKKSFLPVIDPPGKNEIVMVGRLVNEKGVDVLLRAFSLLDKPTYQLRLVGTGPVIEELRNLAVQLNIQERVIFSGFCSNPIPYMKAAELCVVSSVNEGFPNTLLEMMCVARRVVSTECTDGIKGMPGIITCAPASDLALAKAMQQSLLLDQKLANENISKMRNHAAGLTVPSYVETIFDKVHST